jgi:putative radical SAM enzyme (TIGR03279 family)
MRSSLYFKDDDYRLSFIYGNYITLNDVGEKEIDRIIRYNLSPLYVSVHSTVKTIRERLFGRSMRNDIMRQLEQLATGGITIHAQVVVVPEINDGPDLERTARDLFRLYPMCKSLAVVPVGLTKHRSGLVPIRKLTRTESRNVINRMDVLAGKFRKHTGGDRFVHLSDEFYLQADRIIPVADEYGDFDQIANGVGMSRAFIDDSVKRAQRLRNLNPERIEMNIVTGTLGAKLMKKYIIPDILENIPDLKLELIPVRNRMFGRSVGVSGLLAGKDILETVKESCTCSGCLVLPPNSVNHEGIMIDDFSPEDLAGILGMDVVIPERHFLENKVLKRCRRKAKK